MVKEIDEYINKWLRIISEMVNNNTYKLAWGRAIVEICMNQENYSIDLVISFKDIAIKILKYYWNQIFYFNLKQSYIRVDSKEPEIVQYAIFLINKYKEIYQTNIPVWFNKVYPSSNNELNNYFKKIIEKDIPTTLSHDVCYRFLRVSDTDNIDVYSLDKPNKLIVIKASNVEKIMRYGDVLINLLNFKWSVLLEKYNYSPNIGNKVIGLGNESIKRNSLEQYKKILLLQYGENNIKDFYTEEFLPINDISVDHVIPWSFVYEDNLWNLVLTSKSNNSKKRDYLVNFEYIEKLEKRNRAMLNFLHNNGKKYKKYETELEFAMRNNVVKELYNYFRG